MQAAIERPVGDECVVVIRGADDDGIEVLLLMALAPVGVGFRTREPLECVREEIFIHVAKGDEIFAADGIVVGEAPPPNADQGDVELIVR